MFPLRVDSHRERRQKLKLEELHTLKIYNLPYAKSNSACMPVMSSPGTCSNNCRQNSYKKGCNTTDVSFISRLCSEDDHKTHMLVWTNLSDGYSLTFQNNYLCLCARFMYLWLAIVMAQLSRKQQPSSIYTSAPPNIKRCLKYEVYGIKYKAGCS